MTLKSHIYCSHCGQELVEIVEKGRKRKKCCQCDRVFYVNPLPVVSCIVVNEKMEILLVLRKNEPQKNDPKKDDQEEK